MEGRKLAFQVRLSSYRAMSRRRWQSRDRKGCHVTEVTGSDPEVTSFNRKSPASGCGRKTHVSGTFEHLQVCNSQEVAFT